MKKIILTFITLLLAGVTTTAWGQRFYEAPAGSQPGTTGTDLPGTGTQISQADAKAQIGDMGYPTLEEAFAAAIEANASKTITLLANCEVTQTIVVGNGKTLTLDLAGFKVTSAIGTTFKVTKGTLTVKDNGTTKGGIEVSGEAFRVDSRESGVTSASGARLNINSDVNVTSNNDACVFIRGYATVSTSGNLTSNGQYATIQGNGSDQATVCNVTISGGSVTASQSAAVYFPQNGTLKVSGGTVTGYESGIAIKSGTLNVTGGTIHCTGQDTTPTTGWSNGVKASGAAIQVESNNNYGTVNVNISGTPTITSDNGVAVYEYIGAGSNTQLQSMTITGGTFNSGTGKDPLMLSEEAANAKAAAVSGGSFSAPIKAAYCAVGYTPVTEPNANGKYKVTVGQNICKIGDTPYTSFAEAVTAANGTETIVLLANIEEPYTMSLNQTIKVQKAGFNITMNAPAGKYAVKTSTSSGVTTFTIVDAVASITKGNPAVTTYYNTLSAAYSAAATGDEVVVEADISAGGAQSPVFSTPSTNKSVTLNLNGHTVENKGGGTVLYVHGSSGNIPVMNIVGPGTLTTTGTAIKAGSYANVTVGENVTVIGNHGVEIAAGQTTLTTAGTITATEAGIYITGAGTSYENKILNVTGGSISGQYGIYSNQASTVNISAGTVTGTAAAIALNGYYVPTLSDSEKEKYKILVNVTGGTIQGTGEGWAIAGSGNENDGNYEMNLSGGTITAEGCAIYHCNDGVVNVSGTVSITGTTAIYQKSGTLNISGGTINGNGAAADFTHNGNGANATGDAIVVESCGYPGGTPTTVITGSPTITSAHGAMIADYVYTPSASTETPEPTITSQSNTITLPKGEMWVETSTPGVYKIGEAVAQIGDTPYATLEAAVAAATDGQTITLLQDIDVTAQVEIGKQVTLDLNGKTIEYKGTEELRSGVLMILRGGDLTVTDSSTGKDGAIKSGENAYAAIALTKLGEPATGTAAKLTVEAGNLEGKYYAVTGNGNRHGTEVTINGGTLTGTEGTAIYQPQDGTLTITGGTFTGNDTGIELRSGTLNVTGGTFETTATKYSCDPNGNGTTTVGAAIAIAQHTTNKPINAKISDATFIVSGEAKAISVQNPQNNEFDNVEVATNEQSVISSSEIPEGYVWIENGEGFYTLVKLKEIEEAKMVNNTLILPNNGELTTADLKVKDGENELTLDTHYTAAIYTEVETSNETQTPVETSKIDKIVKDGIYYLQLTGKPEGVYKGTKLLTFYVLNEYYKHDNMTQNPSPNDPEGRYYSIHVTEAESEENVKAKVGYFEDEDGDKDVIASGITSLTIDKEVEITLTNGGADNNVAQQVITIAITDIEPNAFKYIDQEQKLSYIDVTALPDTFVPTSLDRTADDNTFSGVPKQTLVFLNGTNVTGENYVYQVSAGVFNCDEFKVYDDMTGIQVFNNEDYDWFFANPYEFTANSITNTRKMTAGQYYTLCLPYELTLPTSLKAYTLDASSATLLGFKEVTGTLAAYTPYIVLPKNTGNLLNVSTGGTVAKSTYTEETEARTLNAHAGGNYSLVGSMDYFWATPTIGGNIYIMQSGNEWKKLPTGTNGYPNACVLPMRAYIQAATGTSGGARLFSKFVDEDGSTTSISNLQIDADDNKVFDLQGRRVTNPQRGNIYIINGRKMMYK